MGLLLWQLRIWSLLEVPRGTWEGSCWERMTVNFAPEAQYLKGMVNIDITFKMARCTLLQ